MKTYAPEYYKHFKCIADKCRHSCCIGWEIDVDETSVERFLAADDVKPHIDTQSTDTPHIRLSEGDRCPFLRPDGLCSMIINHGENFLCQICTDHPRFRNYWTGVTHIGLGFVCEEAARLILTDNKKFKLELIDDDGIDEQMPEDEIWLWELCLRKIGEIDFDGPMARLKESLIYRHLPNALYDGRVEERIRFIDESFERLVNEWDKMDKSVDSLVEIVRAWSYDIEYDDEAIDKILESYN